MSSVSEVSGAASVPMCAAGCVVSSAATWPMSAGGMSGSSPCRFTTTSSSGQPRAAATSAIRSVPEACAAEVISAAAPKARAAPAMRSSSVAISTSLAPAATARSCTHCSMGLPASGSSALPGSRVEA
jgi:hypothetical protein